jgi:NAD-dependent DNA ligase
MNTIQELIKRRRSQLLIHSYIYYVLDSNLITDHQWQDWEEYKNSK